MDYQDYPMPLIQYGKSKKSKQLRVFQKPTTRQSLHKDYNSYPGYSSYSSFSNNYDNNAIIIIPNKNKKTPKLILILLSIIIITGICLLIAWYNKLL
jgi:hypothetical protein